MTQAARAAEATPLSRRAAVYRLYDADDVLLYIGSAYDPEERCKAHRSKPWWPDVARRTDEWRPGRGDAYGAEAQAIAEENPRHNLLGTADHADADTLAIPRLAERAGVRRTYIHRLATNPAEGWPAPIFKPGSSRPEYDVAWFDQYWAERQAGIRQGKRTDLIKKEGSDADD